MLLVAQFVVYFVKFSQILLHFSTTQQRFSSPKPKEPLIVAHRCATYYMVHHILTTDRSIFLLLETTNEAESTPTGESPQCGSLAMSKDSASKAPRSTNANSPGATPQADSAAASYYVQGR